MISKDKYRKILTVLAEFYPTAQTELVYHNGFELLVAVVLSAQTTDKQVNKVTPELFKHFATPEQLGQANLLEVESLINSIGLYRNKSKNIIKLAQIIHEQYHDELPTEKEDLLKLPGVGEKTASVVMGDYYHVPALAVDTHVARLAKRWDVVGDNASVEEVQKKLMELTPKKDWIVTHHRLILFGRYFCTARSPKCLNCELLTLCKYGKNRLKIK
ncbi:endonuclease III [Xylocopilactobacillus apicola]|uniref:Endonuclease III n=1 Tax=Xylocopilactobacillus apicola TaxID=2932184 RepID=A0AAU9DWJ8_9LACO|nr:endonuclease III [Xylocopilactobacillus apicola]BDR58383.1 endonuclease III [Xylocopilactobacillus apicola]